MCRQSHPVARPGPAKTPRRTRNEPPLKGMTEAAPGPTVSRDTLKNELGRKAFSRFDDVLAVLKPCG